MSFFISYSSHDDKNPKKWVVKFHEELKNRLNTLSGKEIPVMLDKYDLDGNVLEKGLEDMLDQTEGLVAVLSPSYINNSKWCTWEREIFLQNLNKLYPEEEPEERLFVAVKLPKLSEGKIDVNYNKQLPSVFERLKKYHFFSIDERGNASELLPTQKQFKVELNDLAHQLISFMEKNTRKSVYLAQTENDSPERDALLKELIANGFNVIPRNNLSTSTQNENQFSIRLLSKCAASVHILTQDLQQKSSSYELAQIERAQRSNVPVLIWNDSSKSNENRFIPTLSPYDDFIEGSFQDFNSVVFDTLEQLKK